MYRPQFAYPLPEPPCNDQTVIYGFDGTNTPALVGTLGAGLSLSKIPLLIDTDAPFFLRAFRVPATGLMVRLEDANDNPLSDCENLAQQRNFEFPALFSETDGAGWVALDSDDWGIFLPAGGAPLVYVYNPTAAPINLNTLFINLAGVKRYPGGTCS